MFITGVSCFGFSSQQETPRSTAWVLELFKKGWGLKQTNKHFIVLDRVGDASTGEKMCKCVHILLHVYILYKAVTALSTSSVYITLVWELEPL